MRIDSTFFPKDGREVTTRNERRENPALPDIWRRNVVGTEKTFLRQPDSLCPPVLAHHSTLPVVVGGGPITKSGRLVFQTDGQADTNKLKLCTDNISPISDDWQKPDTGHRHPLCSTAPIELDLAQADATDAQIGAAFTRMQTLILQNHFGQLKEERGSISYFPTLLRCLAPSLLCNWLVPPPSHAGSGGYTNIPVALHVLACMIEPKSTITFKVSFPTRGHTSYAAVISFPSGFASTYTKMHAHETLWHQFYPIKHQGTYRKSLYKL
ncbi:hypothetical protein BV22DRAFT_1052797 [Leucogyrophana mollusca]|uniref:Uncharacterized protein n=1 Tax=Leucogyrophana mollusca TaxID=85980 RepID=A0ACB8ATZ1_9AGAM|nr:hypothetical protein BV22DRAFT_1052797 [Leucogyrophana mollusca]